MVEDFGRPGRLAELGCRLGFLPATTSVEAARAFDLGLDIG